MDTLILATLFPFVTIGAALALLVIFFNLHRLLSIFTQTLSVSKTEEADAVIINMEQTGLYINNSPQIKLQMQVLPDKGRNFIMETNHVVEVKDLENYKSGNRLKVKYFPGDHHRKPLIA